MREALEEELSPEMKAIEAVLNSLANKCGELGLCAFFVVGEPQERGGMNTLTAVQDYASVRAAVMAQLIAQGLQP